MDSDYSFGIIKLFSQYYPLCLSELEDIIVYTNAHPQIEQHEPTKNQGRLSLYD
jgi:hypothetical protein